MRFEVAPADIDELAEGEPREVAVENARRKALAVATERGAGGGERAPAARDLVLGADTVVTVDGALYGKAANEGEARAMLEALSGRTHTVWGGLAVREGGDLRTAAAATAVRFRALTAAELDWYLASGEWRERAGAYAIQGRGAALVQAVEGDYLNVVGLPVPTLLDLVPDLLTAATAGRSPVSHRGPDAPRR